MTPDNSINLGINSTRNQFIRKQSDTFKTSWNQQSSLSNIQPIRFENHYESVVSRFGANQSRSSESNLWKSTILDSCKNTIIINWTKLIKQQMIWRICYKTLEYRLRTIKGGWTRLRMFRNSTFRWCPITNSLINPDGNLTTLQTTSHSTPKS